MDDGDFVQIERLVRRKRGRPGEEIEVLLSDASSFFVSMRVWEQKPFHEGDSVLRDSIEAIRRDSTRIAIQARAIDLLARAEHSGFLLRQKLLQRGYDGVLVGEVLDALSDQGLLDDRRYAVTWVRSRIRRHPEGRGVLVAGLRQRGVDPSTAEQAVDEVLASEEMSMEQLAIRVAAQLLRARGATAAAVTAKMMRRGFSLSLVRRVVQDLTGSDIPEAE